MYNCLLCTYLLIVLGFDSCSSQANKVIFKSQSQAKIWSVQISDPSSTRFRLCYICVFIMNIIHWKHVLWEVSNIAAKSFTICLLDSSYWSQITPVFLCKLIIPTDIATATVEGRISLNTGNTLLCSWKISTCLRHHITSSTDETFLQDFLEILKLSLQNFQQISKKCFFVTGSCELIINE